MAASGSVFSETLQEITNTKLDELSKRRSSFEDAKASLLSSMQLESNATKRLMILSAGVKKCFAIKLDEAGKVIDHQTKHKNLEIELKNLDRFLDQARYDPSLSAKMLQSWEQSLLRHLDTQSLKFAYASLYGQLVMEWLSSNKEEDVGADGDVEMGEAFEVVSNAKKLKSRMDWEKTVFEPADVDEAALERYLNRLFEVGNKEKRRADTALQNLRSAVESFELQLSTPNQFDISSVKWAIKGLYASDLLSDEKREVLRDFEGSNVILGEVADVLNMRLSALTSWAWNSDAPVLVEMRRKISGIYNIHMHEDLLQAIFLQYIGVKWGVFFKKAIKDFQKSDGAWNSPRKEIPKIDKRRLEYYLGPLQQSSRLQGVRSKIYLAKYFMAQLLDDEYEVLETGDGEEEAEYEQFSSGGLKRKPRIRVTARKSTGGPPPPANRRRMLASIAPRASTACYSPSSEAGFALNVDEDHMEDDEESDDSDVDYSDEDLTRGPMALKQNILHMLATEITINKRLYGEMTAIHSVFKTWESLLPHATIVTVLKFFGVSETWVGFFKKYLEAPLKFVDEDKSTPGRRRRRGTPASHVLSNVLGETALFCLDLSINKSTSGGLLWRFHDDMWFWSRDHGVAVKAWTAVEEFAEFTGTEINLAKSGTVRVSKTPTSTLPVDESLPDGEIRWGFLRLSPQTGTFEIDQVMVDAHIKELSKQLHDQRKSIFDYIQTWNTYAATFFSSNFGKSANCFGQEHVDNMLATHERIQREVFAMSSPAGEKPVSSVAEFLKQALSQRFGINDIPDGYLYFPMELGGLDLQSPFVSLLQIHDEVPKSPSELIESFEQAERDAYEKAKDEFHDDSVRRSRHRANTKEPAWEPESRRDRENFMSFDEYIRHREEFKFNHHPNETRLHKVYNRLMKRPMEDSIDPDDSKVSTAITRLQGQSNLRGITNYWHGMEPYWKWVAMMYGPEIVDRFGGLNIVDPGLLPMGMVSVFRDKRVKWQG